MRMPKSCLVLSALAALLTLPTTTVVAQSERENSTFAITEPIEVGAFTLQPGTYLIKVVMLTSNRNMIQVSNVEQTKVYANVLATPHPIRPNEVNASTRYVYYPAVPGQMRVLRSWFARDTSNGQDIVYPKKRATELAALAREPVIAVPDEVKEAEFKTVPLAIVTPEKEIKGYEEPAAVVAEARPAPRLPATASQVPLAAALAFLSLGGALALRAVARHVS